ncbi:MAG: hypothetical protein V2A77_02785, partial [Pseudomonadota bacterium]
MNKKTQLVKHGLRGLNLRVRMQVVWAPIAGANAASSGLTDPLNVAELRLGVGESLRCDLAWL